MSNTPFSDHSYPNKRARLQDPWTFNEAWTRTPCPATWEQSMAPEAAAMAVVSNSHASLGAPGRTVCGNATTLVPQHCGDWEHHSSNLNPGDPSHHGGVTCQLPLYPDDHPLDGYSYQEPPSNLQDVLGPGPVFLSSAASQLACGYNTSNPQYWAPTISNQFGDSSAIYALAYPIPDLPALPVNAQEFSLLPAQTSSQEVTDFTNIENIMNALDSKDDYVCFGMLVGIPGTCERVALIEASRYSIKLENPESFVGIDEPALRGDVSPDSTFLTTALLEEAALELQVTCTISVDRLESVGNGKPVRVSSQLLKCTLDIILYGAVELSDAICTFIEECNEYLEDQQKLYLQDPIGCDRNVQYCNPHRLPPLVPDGIEFTFDLANKHQYLFGPVDIEPPPELLELLGSQEDLPEAVQPQVIATPLERHQKQALTFMLRREQGWAFDGTRPDIWEVVDSGQRQYFINRVTDTRQTCEPPAFYGGILADPMGFGKTLSMIALVASDARHHEIGDGSARPGVLGEQSCGLTLIILPPALLGTWEEQLRAHVVHLGLPWRLHHGKSRLTDHSDLEDAILVLTTYHTVSTEWRNSTGGQSSVLFTIRWRRVVLDEAHYIRNSESQMAQAVRALDSVSRWAITGTLIQNHLNDLGAILQFLGVYPYNEKRVFDADISHPWKAGNADKAIKRLKYLAGCLILRRPKETVELPPRHDQECYVEFQPMERELYAHVRAQAIARLDEALVQVNDRTGSLFFVNALQQIEAMRMVCNLGLLYRTRHDLSAYVGKVSDTNRWQQAAQRVFNVRFEIGTIQCHYCSGNLDANSNPLGDTESAKPLLAQCMRFICSNCTQRPECRIEAVGCGHDPSCAIASVSTSASSLEEPSISISLTNVPKFDYIPTKVKALVEDLQALPSNVKCVVFSTWRMTLDVVEVGINQAGVSSLRFDGTVPQNERQGVVERFRADPSIRVLLLTLSCGAVGLTLTAASRAYIMEPHWNPTVEDQALARIHRIGQKREVTTIRFYVRDSFEESVIKNQESKRDLAGILLTPSSAQNNSIRHLERLRALI